MALVIKDRVKETTTTTGTGTYTLGGAVTGFETFTANLSNADTTYYACTDNTDFEVGLGTFTSSGTTLARTTILASSNSNNAVDWSSGTRTIFMTYPADKAVFQDASGNINGTFVGNITGNVTGNTSGTAATVTGAAQTNITSVGTLTSLTTSGDISVGDDLTVNGGQIDLRSDSGAVAKMKFYCEVSNAHAQTLQAQPHSAGSSAVLVLPTASGTLVGTGDSGSVSNTMLAGSIANSKLANSSINFGGVSLALGASDTTPAFDLSDATNYPTSSLSGTITNAQLAGSIANAKLSNSSITVSDGSNTSAVALGGTLTFAGTSNEVEVAESSGTVTIGLPSAITANVTGALTGNADTATALATGRTIGMTGDVVWTSASFTGAGNVTGTATIQADAVEQSMIADDAVGADQLASNAVVNASVASGAAIDATKIHDGTISNTEFGYLNNVSSNIQTQIDSKTTLTAASNEATALAIALG